MPSAIGGLTPEYRGADIRCGLNERLGCGRSCRSPGSAQLALSAHSFRSHLPLALQLGFTKPAIHRLRGIVKSRVIAVGTNLRFIA